MITAIISILTLLAIGSGVYLYYNFFAFQGKDKNIRELYTEALDLLITGHRKEAFHNLKTIIKADSDNIKAYIKLGQVVREGGNPAKALRIHRGITLRKNLTSYERLELLKNMVLDLYALNKMGDAIDQCLKILKMDKNNEWALSKLVDFYQKDGSWALSREHMQKLQAVTGNSDSRALARLMLRQGDEDLKKEQFANARTLYEEALNINENVYIAYFLIGNSYSAESELEYNTGSQNGQHSENNSNIQNAKELLSKAVKMWIKYAEHSPELSYNVIYLIKDGLFALDRYSDIEGVFKGILDKNPNNIDVLANLADYYIHKGENEKAIELLTSATKIDSDSFLARMIRLKIHVKDSSHSTEKIYNELDEIIKLLIQGVDLQKKVDEDLTWLKETDGQES